MTTNHAISFSYCKFMYTEGCLIFILVHMPMDSLTSQHASLTSCRNFQPLVSSLRLRLCQMLIPTLIGNLPNAVSVLNVAWNSEDPTKPISPTHMRTTILSSLCNYYMRNPDDQTKLTRILEVAHELKPNVWFGSLIECVWYRLKIHISSHIFGIFVVRKSIILIWDC